MRLTVEGTNVNYEFKQCTIKTLALAIAGAFLLSCGTAFAAATAVINDDFESAALQAAPAGWSGTARTAQATDSANQSKYLVGASASRAGSAPATAILNFADVKGPMAIEFRMRTPDDRSWSTFMSLGNGKTELCKLQTVNKKLVAVTVPGTPNHEVLGGFPTPRWMELRLEFNTDRENDNFQVFVSGKLTKILTVPALYTVSVNWIGFGYLAAIDDLKITSGPGSFNPPPNPEKFLEINARAVNKRTAENRIPDGVDPFTLFLKDEAPKVIKTLSEETRGDVTVRKIIFLSRPAEPRYNLIESEVYGVIARPVASGKFPGLLVLHGGMGVAAENMAVSWASRGYIAMAIDVPGVANPVQAIHSRGIAQLPYGINRFSADPDATTSTFFDAILAGAQAVKLLKTQADVIPDRIGVTGISWGGFTTTGVAGVLGNQLKAAFSVYGCGYIDRTGMNTVLDKLPPAERETWLKYIDAGRLAKNIKAAYFIDAPTNDGHFWPPAVSATLAEIPGEKNQLITPNEGHKATVPGGTMDSDGGSWLKMEIAYFDYYLKGKGFPLPVVAAVGQPEKQADGKQIRVHFEIKAPVPLTSVKVFCNSENEPEWPKRKWVEVIPKEDGKLKYKADLPADGPADLYWFAMVSDERPVSVSSAMEKIKR